jgi:hypothetical protein
MRMKHPIHGFHNPQGSEEAEMRKNGWVDDVPEVAPIIKAEVVHAPVEMPKPRRPELIALAEEKGIKVDQRWSNDRLAAEIEKE